MEVKLRASYGHYWRHERSGGDVMWSVRTPSHTASFAFATCISQVIDAGLHGRLERATPEVIAAAERYFVAAEGTALHLLQQPDFRLSEVTADEMIAVYERRMVPMRSRARFIYDELKSAPAHGRCPLCGHRDVTTLDHHLPKSVFPALAVDPMNLIPVCGECNKMKGSRFPQIAEEQTLHPYFDNIDADPWLCGSVLEVAPPTVSFFVSPPACWDETLALRVQLHFKKFGLSALYGSQAANEIAGIKYNLVRMFEAGGTLEVKKYLDGEAASRHAHRVNSWQTALYAALAASEWFCSGGFAVQ